MANGHNLTTAYSVSESKQWLWFSAWVGLSVCLFLKPVVTVIQLALRDETYSHILLVPLIVAWVLYTERNQSEASIRSSPWPGLGLLIVALVSALLLLLCNSCAPHNLLALYIASLVLLVVAGFCFVFGWRKT